MVARESQLVALVDAHGAATGSCTVAEAHTAPGRLHLAPAEVADVRWLAPDWLRVDLADNPDRYAPWLRGAHAVTTEAAGHLTSYPFPVIQQEARPGAVGAGAVPSTAGTTATRPESANQTPRLKPAQHNR